METVTEAPRKPLHRLTAWLSGVGTLPGGQAAAPSEAEAASPPVLLSTEQISPQQQEPVPQISYSKGGNLVKVKLPGVAPRVRGDRECIRCFSAKSKRALHQLVASIDQQRTQAKDFAFGTLTYPAKYPSAAATKVHLDQLLKRFEREWGHRWLIWKLEPQKRGAPHYHLLIYMGSGFDEAALCVWMAHAWNEIAGNGNPKHLRVHLGQAGSNNRPCIEVVQDFAAVSRYAGKYLGKISFGDEEWKHPGRYWGQRRDELAPIEMITEDVDHKTAIKFRRVLVRFYEKQPTGFYYFTGRQSTISGKHKAGYRRHRRDFSPGGDVSKLTPWTLVDLAHDLEREIRPQFRRWKRGQGGFSTFMAAATVQRLLKWASTPHPARTKTKVN